MSMHTIGVMTELQKQIDALASTVMGLQGALIIEQTKRAELASRIATLENAPRQPEQRNAPQVKQRTRV